MKTGRKACAVAFLKSAVAYYKSLAITVERVMTDNASCYRSGVFRSACTRRGLKHIFTKPYTPRPTARLNASLLDASLQLAQTLWQYRIGAAHQHTRSDREQPVEALGSTGASSTQREPPNP